MNDINKVLPLLVSHNDIQMYRVTPNVGSTKINNMNNIRPFNSDLNKYIKSILLDCDLFSFFC